MPVVSLECMANRARTLVRTTRACARACTPPLSCWPYVFGRLISMISRCPSLVVHCFHGSDAHRAAMMTGVLRDRFDVLITTYALPGGERIASLGTDRLVAQSMRAA